MRWPRRKAGSNWRTTALFFDEISEISLSLQGKLLRVLQEMEFERVGGTETINVDMRLISAANRNPKQGVQEGWFRADLLYRLNVIDIQLPPLEDHREDIPVLVDHFIARFASENAKRIAGISNRALDVLMDYSFPGNIRELENIVERAVILTREREIRIQDLPEELANGSGVDCEKNVFPNVNGAELLKSLKEINISGNGGSPKYWGDTLKCTSIDKIHEFLMKTSTDDFSRVDFTRFLSQNGGGKRNKYGTAGRYLSILKENRICVHNEKKANQSRLRLSESFLSNA